VENSIFRMHPFRLIQYIVAWYCICHLILVILLKAAIFVWGWISASLKNHDEFIRSFEAGDAEIAEALRKATILKNIEEFAEKFKKEEGDEN